MITTTQLSQKHHAQINTLWDDEYPITLAGRFPLLLNDALKNDLPEFYGWVVDSNAFMKNDGTPYISPLPFYTKLGFEVLPHKRIDNDMINAVKIRHRRNCPSIAMS